MRLAIKDDPTNTAEERAFQKKALGSGDYMGGKPSQGHHCVGFNPEAQRALFDPASLRKGCHAVTVWAWRGRIGSRSCRARSR